MLLNDIIYFIYNFKLFLFCYSYLLFTKSKSFKMEKKLKCFFNLL
jgi:hypothetical protein